MRNKIITGVVSLMLLASSCVKEKQSIFYESAVGAYLSYIGGTSGDPQKFEYSTIATTTATIKVKNVGSPADKINIYVGTSSDKSTWKLIKTVSFTDSTTLTVNGAEVAKALGVAPSALSPGNTYTFYNEVVTKDGRMFSAANTNDDFQGQASYKMAFVWQASVFCSFSQSAFNGSFKVVKDGWADFSVGDLITVSPGPTATQITIIAYPAPQAGGTNRKSIVLDVNPGTNAVTVKSQVYGDYPPSNFNLSVRGTGSVNSCTGTITLSLIHSEGAADFGTFALILQK
jgi:hypothetical protein